MAKEPQPEVSATDIDAVAMLQYAIFLHLTEVCAASQQVRREAMP